MRRTLIAVALLAAFVAAPLAQRPSVGALRPGDMATDFTLEPREGEGEAVTLSDLRGKTPVALVFGSFT